MRGRYDYIDRALLAATLQAEASVTDAGTSPLWKILAVAVECGNQGTQGGKDAALGVRNWLQDIVKGA